MPARKAGEPLTHPAAAAQPEVTDRPLPINLATALRLADARPLIIEAARAAIETEYGLYQQARALWLPTVTVGFDYQRHDGGEAQLDNQPADRRHPHSVPRRRRGVGSLRPDRRDLRPPGGAQLVNARNIQIQIAKNDALLSVAVAYFDVQQARGNLAGTQDCVVRARELVRRVGALGRGLAPAIEVERVNTLLAYLEQQAALARRDWLTSSAG